MKKRILSFAMAVVMVIGMIPMIPMKASAEAEYPFTAITTDMGNALKVEKKENIGYSYYGEVPYYHVTIPENSSEVYVTHPLSEDPFADESYNAAYGYYTGIEDGYCTDINGYMTYNFEKAEDGYIITLPLSTMVDTDSDWTPDTEGSFVADEDGYVGYALAVERNDYSPICFFTFEYGTAEAGGEGNEETNSNHFVSINIGENKIANENIDYKGIFNLGDFDADDADGPDGWDYVHEVPYYQVTVPCGTEFVDVTYSADTNIMNSGSNAYGYKTDLEIDAMSSATIKGATFKDGYTKNDDGTQTVTTPVKGYTFDAEGNGHAITLEEDGGSYAAVCLFSFLYDKKNHVFDEGKITTDPTCDKDGVRTYTCSCGESYTEAVKTEGHDYIDGTCSVCGDIDPDYVVPGLEIPEGAPFTAIETDKGSASLVVQMDDLEYSYYGTVPYYHVTIPANAAEVYVTHPSSEDPFADEAYDAAYGYYTGIEDGYCNDVNGYMTYSFEAVEDGYSIKFPLSKMIDTDSDWVADTEVSFVADEEGNVGYAVAVERNDYSPICFFTFEYAQAEEGEHVHSYDEGVVTTNPTCVADGVKTFTCNGCKEGTEGHSYTETVAKTGHAYDNGEVTTEATCAANGVKTFTCQNAGCTESTEGHTTTETIGKKAHSYNEGVVDPVPTCTEAGVRTYTCSVCPEGTEGHTKTETVPAAGHQRGDDTECDVCGDVSPVQDENGVYQIGTAKELLWFANTVNNGDTGISGKLTANIDLSEYADSDYKVNWPGIGTSTNSFKGTFDGQGKTVTLKNTTWGLFGYVMGTNNNHNLKDAVVIQNVIIEGTVKNSALAQNAGYARITNCVNKADITGGNANVAGIVGTVKGSNKYGQIYSDVVVQNCANEGDINGSQHIGGIVGYTQAKTLVDNCYNTGNIAGTKNVGGLFGYMQGSTGSAVLKNSYNTGAVTGTSETAGLVGNMYNGASVENCYNSGEAAYAIAGNIYNNKNTGCITNTYYRGDLCTYSVPNKTQSAGYYTNGRGVAMTSAEMSGSAIVESLGNAFQQSCPSPVFTWQEANVHGEDIVCEVCKQGSSRPTEYKVTFVTTEGVEIEGDTTFRAGNDYQFSVKVLDGYDASELKVRVNGAEVNAVNSKYLVEKPDGPFYISVEGVKKLEGILSIVLPADGKGYRVNPCEGYGPTVESGNDYKFTVSFVDGFEPGEDFKVKANDEELTADENGVYTIANIIKTQTITAEDIDAIPDPEDTVTVNVEITKGQNEFVKAKETETVVMDKQLEVPYFDLELYDLEKYYYNPYCYVDKDGNINGQQKVGNRETAYGVVTSMHAFIYMTEVYYLGYDPEDAGLGYSDIDSEGDGVTDFDEAVSWTQGVGSSFMNLWGLGSNLNYHLNYEYPLGYEGWGSTSDQQALTDGDRLSVHMIEGSASGSGFGFFVVDDTNNTYDRDEVKDSVTVKQGDSITLTYYLATQGDKYTTAFVTVPDKELYWVAEGDETGIITEWNPEEGFGTISKENFKTNENGEIVIDTAEIEPGTYYIGAAGCFNKGTGKPGSDGFVSSGAESGPAYFKLIVEEGTCKHNFVSENTDAAYLASKATCTKAAKYYKSCENCGEKGTEIFTYGEPLEHKWTKAVASKYLASKATCTKAAKYYKSCENCGEQGTKTFTSGKAKGHSYSTKYTVDKKATAKANGSKSKHCTRCDAKTSKKTIYKASGVKLSKEVYTYNGNKKNPSVIIKDSEGNTISSKNYTVTKPSGRKLVGKYTYKITFKNEYSGTKKLTLTIKPKATSIKSLSKAKKAFTVKWKKQSTQVTGYQIQYSTSKSFATKNTKTISKASTTSTTIKGLKAKRTYYVRVRTYKDTKASGKVYSDWSTVTKVKTK